MISPGGGPSPRVQRPWLRRFLFLAAGCLGLGLVAALATLVFGHISGQEFCPDTFSRRAFAYFEVPWLGVQVSPIDRHDLTNRLETALTTGKFVAARTDREPQWDLVLSKRSGVVDARGDAALLCTYLDSPDQQGNLFWQEWTEKHADLAKIFWPLVVEVAHRRLYLFVPDLFEIARQATDPAALDRDLRAALARDYDQLAAIQQQLGHHATAVELWDQSLAYVSDNVAARRKQAESSQAIAPTNSAAKVTAPAENSPPNGRP